MPSRRRPAVATVQSVIQRAFAGGELAPALGARADQTKYLTGLATCRNFLVQRHGGVTKRPGTRFIAAVKHPAVTPRLIPFIFEANDQTYLIEAGDGYFRFFWHGAPVVTGGGAVYEVASPYSAAEVQQLHWTQSADVLTLTHPHHVPQELQRLAHTTWQLVPYTTQPSIAAPTGVAATAGVTTGPWPVIRYVVTAAKVGTFEESYASTPASVTTGPPSREHPNVVTWTPVADAEEYWVYADLYRNGIFGFLSTAKDPTFNDVGMVPDFAITPPIPVTLFTEPDTYPSTCVYFQQRLMFANAITDRETVWGSQVGSFHNFAISTPLQDDDAVTFVLASSHLNPVAHLVGLKRLIVLTDEGEWVIHGDENGTLRPTTINADQEGYVGANAAVRPVVVGNALLYVEARQPLVRELSFEANEGGRIGQDLTVYAPHLFLGYGIVELGYAHAPHSIIWAVRSDGTLLGLTYLREQEVWGWHRHDTAGAFEAVCVLPDTATREDAVYVVVRRTIDGATVRYVERFASLQVATPVAWCFVDASLAYAGAAATTLTGLAHLAGEVVAVLGDGVVLYDGDPTGAAAASFTVSPGGTLTLPVAVSTAQVGLPIRFAEIETLDLDVEGSAIRDKEKRVQALTALVEATPHGFLAGPDAAHLIAERPGLWEAATTGVTGQLAINLTCAFSPGGRVIIRSPEPVPCTVLGVLPRLEVGG